jgi:hypothetical protein
LVGDQRRWLKRPLLIGLGGKVIGLIMESAFHQPGFRVYHAIVVLNFPAEGGGIWRSA